MIYSSSYFRCYTEFIQNEHDFSDSTSILNLPSQNIGFYHVLWINFLSNFTVLSSGVQKSHFESVLGSSVGASYGIKFDVYVNPTDTAAAVLGHDTLILGFLWWGDTISTYLKSAWNPWEKVLNKCPQTGNFYRLACCIFPCLAKKSSLIWKYSGR